MANYYRSTIQKGSQGEDVLNWQKFLQSQGYDFSKWGGPDGIFGDATDGYTRDWQQKNGIGVDGIVGETTWGKAGYTYLSPTAPTAPTYNTDATDLPETNTTPYDKTEEGTKTKDVYEKAKDKVDAHNEKGFTFSEQEWLNKIKESIENFDKFSYNFNEDALYQQAVERYSQMGKMAMADTMGQAATMTGGYGNSYAQSVGQQTYQNYLQEAHDMLPEYYQMALDRYQMRKDDLYNQYGMLLSEYEREYGLHSDEYQKLLDALGIASDAYYKGGEIYRTEQGIENEDKWNRYEASETLRRDENTLIQNGYENELSEWDANTDNYWRDRTYDDQYGSSDNNVNNGGVDLSSIPGINTTDPTWFDENGNFKKAEYLGPTADGKSSFRIEGKTVVFDRGVNPYTQTYNEDCKYGTRDNGYQPDNVASMYGGDAEKGRLSDSGIDDYMNGVWQNIWQTPDGKLWIWDATQNKYEEYHE